MKYLFLPFTPSLAHITRCLSVAEALKRLNHECLFAVGVEGKEFIEKAGFKTRIIPEVDANTFKKDRGWNWLTEEYFLNNVNAELSIIEEFKPDKIVFDFRFTTAISAKLKGIPSISIIHGNVLSLVLEAEKSAIDIISSDSVQSLNSFKNKILKFIFPKVFKLMLKRPVKRINHVLRLYNYHNIHTPFDLLFADINLIADIPELLSENIKVPDNCHIVGPLMWTGWSQDENFFLDEYLSKPIVYVTMGSTVEAKPTLLKLIEVLSDLPYNIVISKGNDELHVENIPLNIHVFPYVPGQLVAQNSSLVIYHGGHETLMQVLSAGVPSLIIPSNPDQILVAKQVQKIGIGTYLKNKNSFPMESEPLKDISVEEIKNQVELLINDSNYHDNCKRLKKKMDEHTNSKSFLEYL